MPAKLKSLHLLLKEVQDPAAAENFYRIKKFADDTLLKVDPSPGGSGSGGDSGGSPTPATEAPTVIKTFTTDAATVAGNLLRLSGPNTVTKITDNTSVTVPHGIFGVGVSKPTLFQINVTFLGIVGGFGGFTAGLPLFISTTGIPTHTVPLTGMIQQIGWAISTTEMWVQIMQPFRRA